MIPVVYLMANIIGTFDYSKLRPIPLFLAKENTNPGQPKHSQDLEQAITHSSTLGEEYFANDGVVPIVSQWHPLSCR